MAEPEQTDTPTLDDLVCGLSATVEASGYLLTRLNIVGQQLGVYSDEDKVGNGENAAGSVYSMLKQAVEQARSNKNMLERLVRDLERNVGVNQPVATDSGGSSGRLTPR